MTIEDLLGYFFFDRGILERSLTRPVENTISCDQIVPRILGEAVLSTILLDLLFRDGVSDPEKLIRERDSIMKREILASVGEQLSIWSFIRLKPDEEHMVGEQKSIILADTLEALIGGIFIDGGYEGAEQRVKRWFSEYLP